MAITSLALSLLFCVPFVAAIASIVLGVIVLGRSKDGRDHGRGMAIAGIVISTVVMLATVALLVVAVVGDVQVQMVLVKDLNLLLIVLLHPKVLAQTHLFILKVVMVEKEKHHL